MSKNKSRHNLSHHRMLTYPMGYNVPTLTRLLIPGDEVDLRSTDVIRLDPFQYSIMDTCHVIHSTYFVPLHQLFEGFERFITGLVTDAPNVDWDELHKNLIDQLPWFPYAWMPTDDIGAPLIGDVQMNRFQDGYKNGTGLFSYLGIPIPSLIRTVDNETVVSRPGVRMPVSQALRLNALAFLAYHKIVDDYYRDEEMEYQSLDWPLDVVKHSAGVDGSGIAIKQNLMLNPTYWYSIRGWRDDLDSRGDSYKENGFLLRRCNWEPDYLTTRRPHPQRGMGETVDIGQDGLLTVDELREATAIQNMKLAQQRSGGRLDDFYKKFYGVENSNCTFGKCDQIAHESMGLQISDIHNTMGFSRDATGTEIMPLGDVAGYSKTIGSGDRVKYTAKSFGILMRFTRVLPRTTYHYSIDPLHTMTTQFDFFNERLEAIGWQPVPRSAVYCAMNTSSAHMGARAQELTAVTGWQPPYEWNRRQLSYTFGSFNILNGDAPIYEWTFARDFSTDGSWIGDISPNFRKADPVNHPFAIADDSPTQVQHYAEYDFHVESVVPYAINNRCLTH